MRVEFLKDYSARTTAGGMRTVEAGTVLDISPEKAALLVASGIVVEAGSIPALWQWFVAAADRMYQAGEIPAGAWEAHKSHRNQAVRYLQDGRMAEARQELENALCALCGTPPLYQTDGELT